MNSLASFQFIYRSLLLTVTVICLVQRRDFLWPEFCWFIAKNFAKMSAIKMSRSILVHFSFNFYRMRQADYGHAMYRSLAKLFMV